MIRLWKHLHREKAQETQAEASLRKKYNEFLAVLFENEYSLDLLTRLEEKHYSNQLISLPYLKAMITKLSKHLAVIVENLIQLSGGEHLGLREVYASLDSTIRQILTGSKEMVSTPIIIPLAEVTKEMADKVGNKMANLGDLQHHCRLRVPVGFAATACSYTHFLEYNHLADQVQGVLSGLDLDNGRQLLEAEKTIKRIFLAADIPPEIEQSIRRESEKLEREKGRPLFWAVRSSAIGEDLAESSFAGQFSTVLNVRTADLARTYKEVAASKYNAKVIMYQRLRNIRDDDVAMSVGFMEMIDPVCSGVMYTQNPLQPDQPEIVINAVWGVGELLVEGVVSADVHVLGRGPGFPLLRQEIADKQICLGRLAGGGLRQLAVSPDKAFKPALDRPQLHKLGEMALRVEEHFQAPQDIEWCFDGEGRLYMLQSRPLRLCEKTAGQGPAPRQDATVIVAGAQPISPGTGRGRVLKSISIHDLPEDIPRGTVLVLKHSSPKYIVALRKVSAVLVEQGNWTDHMSSVIREFGVPCLVRAAGIFELEDGAEVTVDADAGVVYAGAVALAPREKTTLARSGPNTPVTESQRLLKEMAPYIFPLNLTDPRTSGFTPGACRTWHDILRFCHETALNEMFQLKEKSRLQSAKNVYRIDTALPFILYVLDVTGNTVRGNGKGLLAAEGVKSLPFEKLWQGMTDPAINWRGPEQDIRARDLLTAMLRTPSPGDAFDTRSYAVVGPEYLNLSLSMGYHYIVLDCYLSDDAFNNYIALSFKGGAADAGRRNLRVAFVAEVLRRMGFQVTTANDFLKARLKSESARELGRKLMKIGQLFGVTRLLDLAMEDESQVREFVAFFEAHDFSLGLSRQR